MLRSGSRSRPNRRCKRPSDHPSRSHTAPSCGSEDYSLARQGTLQVRRLPALRRLRPHADRSAPHSLRPAACDWPKGQRRIHRPCLSPAPSRTAPLRRRGLLVGRGERRSAAHRARAVATIALTPDGALGEQVRRITAIHAVQLVAPIMPTSIGRSQTRAFGQVQPPIRIAAARSPRSACMRRTCRRYWQGYAVTGLGGPAPGRDHACSGRR